MIFTNLHSKEALRLTKNKSNYIPLLITFNNTPHYLLWIIKEFLKVKPELKVV